MGSEVGLGVVTSVESVVMVTAVVVVDTIVVAVAVEEDGNTSE